MPQTPTMRRVKRAAAARRRAEEEVQAAALAAMDAGDNQSEIAEAIGRSREYLRLLRLEAAKRQT